MGSDLLVQMPRALAGKMGMTSELVDVSRSVYNKQLPKIWRRLCPESDETLKNFEGHIDAQAQEYPRATSETTSSIHANHFATISNF